MNSAELINELVKIDPGTSYTVSCETAYNAVTQKYTLKQKLRISEPYWFCYTDIVGDTDTIYRAAIALLTEAKP